MDAPDDVPVDEGVVRLPDGRDLAWSATGPADGPVVLFLHGSTGSRRTAPAADGVRVLAYDRPGFGGSTAAPDRTLATDAADVGALLDAVGAGPVAVLAFSGGAPVGYELAALTPARVTRLTVVSGAPRPTEPPPPDELLRTAAAALRADPDAAVDSLLAGAPPADARALASPRTRERITRGVRDAVAAGIEGWVAEGRLIRSPWPFAPADVRVPVALWHGDRDDAVPLHEAQGMVAVLPDAALTVLPDAGHLGWMARESDGVRAAVAPPDPVA
ncbi:alpha/beta fold hydrolase [Patulibacter sp. SYSU D01012]|uniref:alpha/beta fold hydrolase n=1 Tax=Patulibacter sp. SYSU D01012 TaxID=2817381 RepID=UPI001B307B65|nr:alpha/beta fold hydrolase [Patulibacter sp. SYSU D01012]